MGYDIVVEAYALREIPDCSGFVDLIYKRGPKGKSDISRVKSRLVFAGQDSMVHSMTVAVQNRDSYGADSSD
jgi:hypothetical protein